mmetsp:Transcript_24108/g.67924  ORF Transcript_24108/g.67924 Transcript_24108/m.67924 type:complete len:264 (-) Transcript_24108:13-804(-)
MQISANDQRMQRIAQVLLRQLLQRACHHLLRRLPHPRQSDAKRLSHIVRTLLVLLLRLRQLLGRSTDRHVPRRQKLRAPFHHGLEIRLLHLDIQQAQGVHPALSVVLDLRVKAGRPPLLVKERDAHGVAKVVQLQTASAGCAHDRRVVHHLHLHAQLLRSQDQVRVRGGAHGISHDQKRHLPLAHGRPNDQFLCLVFDQPAVGHADLRLVKLLHAFLADPAQDRCVRFQEHVIGRLDQFLSADGDILFVSQSKTDHVQNHAVL